VIPGPNTEFLGLVFHFSWTGISSCGRCNSNTSNNGVYIGNTYGIVLDLHMSYLQQSSEGNLADPNAFNKYYASLRVIGLSIAANSDWYIPLVDGWTLLDLTVTTILCRMLNFSKMSWVRPVINPSLSGVNIEEVVFQQYNAFNLYSHSLRWVLGYWHRQPGITMKLYPVFAPHRAAPICL